MPRAAMLGKPLFETFPDNPDDPAAGVRTLYTSLRSACETGKQHAIETYRYDIRTIDGQFLERYWRPCQHANFDQAGRALDVKDPRARRGRPSAASTTLIQIKTAAAVPGLEKAAWNGSLSPRHRSIAILSWLSSTTTDRTRSYFHAASWAGGSNPRRIN
jgi:hypothetical protein